MIRTIRYLMILLTIFASIESINAQKDSTFTSRNTFYTGFANEGAIYSINYDRIFSQNNKLAWSYRIGFSILDNAIAMPFGINLFTGKGNSHAEFSFTVIPYIVKYKSFLSSDDLSDKYIYLIPGIVYRFQKPKGGLFFKALASPTVFLDPPSSNFWKMDPKLQFLVHVGIGYSF
jgi:hypothetical protein